MAMPVITRAEIDSLATQWCKAKHVVVIIDDVSKQFALDAVNLVLKNFVIQLAEQVEAKKAAAKAVANGEVPVVPVKKSSLVLTDL